ncbi:MAG: gas vesicle protein GvpN [Proteobacteria bacterium]|nr:gas vesicle protein GvpN [Pseudomonadota bacterium]
MNKNAVRIVSTSTARELVGEDSVQPEPSDSFITSPYVEQVAQRALAYLVAGYPVHFSGVSGTGKTTMAFHVASKLGRPVTLVHGDDEFGSSDLVGKDSGYRKNRLVDNYIHSVLKTEEEMKSLWVDNRLTTACERGEILIYDEFNRSKPEANNPLLSVLSEGILNLPKLRSSGEGYMSVHPEFRAIFTSNPEEYAGVHKTQDALMDRMITIHLEHYDRDTEIMIVRKKSGLPRIDSERIVDIVRELRSFGVNNSRPTIRAGIAIGRILASQKRRARGDDAFFQIICRDVLATDTAKITRGGQPVMTQKVEEVISKFCGSVKTAKEKVKEVCQ